ARRRRRLDAKHDSATGHVCLAGDARPSYHPSMEETILNNDDPLEHMLHRSNALHERLDELLGNAEFDGSPRGESALGMCLVAMEHAAAMRALMSLRLPTSAVGLMRLQFEALTRAMWLLYAASDAAIDKLLAPLTQQSEQAAKNLPGASEMIEQIGKRVGQGAPAAAHQMLLHFKDVTWHGMNSFVHGGIHPLRRSADGFPVDLALQVLRSSNGLTTMTGMTMAVLTGDEAVAKPVSKIQPAFADCLPDLLRP
ncbi:DUF6988 family protein, partial [Stenotrophomonas maltophilia group sp. Smal13]|uniref:DUF6988 family protein n=2 Tax=Pseudomonadota TaxID=1224 RepID=UPI0031BAB467